MIEFLQNYVWLTAFVAAAAVIISGAAWAVIYYLTYAIRSQILGKTVWHGRADTNAVALTFDDGPAPDTLELLKILQANNIKATFFLIGREVEKYPEIARRIVAEGHEIGNHSYSHPIYLFSSATETKRQLCQTQETIREVTGITPEIARPPCGVRSAAYFAAAKTLNLRTIQWSVAGFDWKKRTAGQIAAAITEKTQAGAIILLHDGDSAQKHHRRATIDAIPLLVKALERKGLTIVPLKRLLESANTASFATEILVERNIYGK